MRSGFASVVQNEPKVDLHRVYTAPKGLKANYSNRLIIKPPNGWLSKLCSLLGSLL